MSTMGYVSTMEGAAESANLSLDFLAQSYRVREAGKLVNKTFDELFAVNRPGTGGCINSKGWYDTVPPNQPRFDYDPITKLLKGVLIEQQRTNLVLTSSDMRTWPRTRVTLIQNAEVSPDGKLNAVKLVPSTVADWHYTSCPLFPVVAGTAYTQTIYAKAGEYPRVRVGFMDTNVFSGVATFDLLTGVRVGGNTGAITPVGNGWFRITLTLTARLTSNSSLSVNPVKPGETDANTAGDGVSGIYIWGGQVETAPVASSYVPSVETFTSRSSAATYFNKDGLLMVAGVDVPRSDAYAYSPSGTLTPIGLLLESNSTNLLRDSNHFKGVIWIRASGVTLTNDETLAPDGTMATRVDLAGVDAHNINQPLPTPLAAVPHTLSIWVKARVGAFNFQMAYYGDGISQVASSIVPKAEWTRHTFTFTPVNAAVASPHIRLVGFANGLPGDSCYIFGAQLETGTVSTYIPSPPTFTGRATAASFFDKTGVMRTAPANVPRDNAYSDGGLPIGLLLENSATNLITETSSFENLPWGKQSTAAAVSGLVSPTGEDFFRLLTITGSAGTPALNILLSSVAPAAILTQSFYVKAGSTDKCSLRFYDAAGEGGRATFDLTTGVVQATSGSVLVSADIVRVGKGIYRVSMTANYTTRSRAGLYAYLIPDFNAPALGKSIYAWGAQIEVGAVTTSYIASKATFTSRASTATYLDSTGKVSTADVNVERSEAYGRSDSGALVRIGSLLEPAATNMITYSSGAGGAWGNAVSGAATITATANAAAAPDGATTATKLVFSPKVAGDTQLRRFQVAGITDGVTLSPSVWLKADSPTTISLRQGAGGQGVVEVPIGTEWTRITMPPGTNVGTTFNFDLAVPTSLASPAGRTLYVWGAQLETGSVHTSLVPTNGSSATRAADIYTSPQATRAADMYTASQATRATDGSTSATATRAADLIVAKSIAPWYSGTEGTLAATFLPGPRYLGTRTLAVLDDGTGANRMAMFDGALEGNGVSRFNINDVGYQPSDIPAVFAEGVVSSMAIAWSVKDGFSAAAVGRASSTSAVPSVPPVNTLRLGSPNVGGTTLNGHLQSLQFYPVRMTDAQRILLTT